MGSSSKIVSVFFRAMELISASIVAGILGTYLHYIDEAGARENGRIVYTIAIAGIAIFFSLVLFLPLRFSFYAFPFDFAMFAAWIVAFGLLVNLSKGCNSAWFRSSWGWAWGRWYRVNPVPANEASLVGTASCGRWRVAVAWCFIGGFFWLLSSILGVYVLSTRRTKLHRNPTAIKPREETHVTGDWIQPTYADKDINQVPSAVVADEQPYVACARCRNHCKIGSKFCNGCGSELAPGGLV